MILPLPTFGSIGYFAQIVQTQEPITIAINEIIDRKNKRNRYITVDNNGIKLNTIPLYKPRDRKYLSQAIIANEEDWQRDQWRNLTTSYNNSPFFEFYDYKFQELFVNKYDSLLQFNKDIFDIVLSILKVKRNYGISEQPQNPINLKSIKSFQPYQQVFFPQLNFQENTCILDLIFNLGPDSKTYLNQLAFSSE